MKRLLELMGCLLIALSLVSFTSCGDSSDDEGGSGGGTFDQRLVGTWYDESHYNFVCGFKFERNGTCFYGEWMKGQQERFNTKTETRWTTDGNKLHFAYKFDDGETDSESCQYAISENGTTLTLYGGEFDGTYIKQ